MSPKFTSLYTFTKLYTKDCMSGTSNGQAKREESYTSPIPLRG